jgi:hypothetical protein
VLETTTALVAAWPGRLLRLDGAGVGAPADGTRIVIDLTIERPVAVASQLNEMRVVAASDEAGQLGPDS